MRRKDREVTDLAEICDIIDSCEVLRLGLADGDFPYIVPVNFAWRMEEGTLCFYIHGAMAGRKYELLRKNPLCSFEMDVPLGTECIEEARDATMRYRSVMGTARAEFVADGEKERIVDGVIMARSEKTRHFDYNRAVLPRTAVIRLSVLSVSGKQNLPHGGADA